MTHYLIHLGAGDGASTRIQESPREYLRILRDAVNEARARLDTIWLTDDGASIIAIVYSSDPAAIDAIRGAVSRSAAGKRLTITRLMSLQEISPRRTVESELKREEWLVDSVDLGSDLSFPASDPPSWLWEYGHSPTKPGK